MKCEVNEMERLNSIESQLRESIDSAPKLRCYAYSRYGYSVHIICGSYPDGDLGEKWEHLNNTIALTIQAQIQNPVERYNIYLLIFEADISMELRTVIENNRYCCRKIVVQESMPENEDLLQTLVENRLFHFIGHSKTQENMLSVEIILHSADPSGNLFKLISNLKARISDEDAQRAINIL